MSDAIDAHRRLVEKLRDRTRTHRQTDQPSIGAGRKYSREEREELKRRLSACFAKGLDRKRAAQECGCTNKTIVRLFGKIRFVNTRRMRAR